MVRSWYKSGGAPHMKSTDIKDMKMAKVAPINYLGMYVTYPTGGPQWGGEEGQWGSDGQCGYFRFVGWTHQNLSQNLGVTWYLLWLDLAVKVTNLKTFKSENGLFDFLPASPLCSSSSASQCQNSPGLHPLRGQDCHTPKWCCQVHSGAKESQHAGSDQGRNFLLENEKG